MKIQLKNIGWIVLLGALIALGSTSCNEDGDTWPSSCENDEIDGQETDVDCGGPTCEPCSLGKACELDSDCESDHCTGSICSDPESCGNGQLDPGESCDGDCPTGCDDGDPCTDDELSGSAEECNAECLHAEITECVGGDGCCPDGCDEASDGDCEEPFEEICLTVPPEGGVWEEIPEQTGSFEAVWEVTPAIADVDAAVALSSGPATGPGDWQALAATVMFSRDSTIQGFDGDSHVADLSVSYEPGQTYRLRQVVDVQAHRYSIHVTAPGGEEQVLAENYAFRESQATVSSLDHMVLMSGVGSLRACLLSLEAIELPVEVRVTPSEISLVPGGSQQFEALVTQAVDPAVSWSLDEQDCGSVNAEGLYEAPTEEKTCHLRATSIEDPSAWGLATIRIVREQENPYLEPVNIPAYDPSDPLHCLIPDDAPWSGSTLNNSTYRHFYVRPGNYSGRVDITLSGTNAERRTITPYDGSLSHPGKLDDANRAKVAIKFDGASYWTVSRMSANSEMHGGASDRGNFCFGEYSEHNIVDSVYLENGWIVASFAREANENIFQNSFMNGVAPGMLVLDIAFIMFASWSGDPINTMNNKVINNEFRNFRPSKLHGEPDEPGRRNFEGTIIDSNVVWFDGEVWCDADGTPNPNGNFSFAETGWGGPKAASLNPENPVRYSNNVLWGCKPTYPDAPSYLSSPYPGFATCYFDANHVVGFGNVITETYGGIRITSNTGQLETSNCRFEKNIMYRVGDLGYSRGKWDQSIIFHGSKDSVVRDNVVKDPRAEWAGVFGAAVYGENYIGENDIINKDLDADITGAPPNGWDTNRFLSSAEGNAKYPYDYVIHYYKFTNSPQTRVIPKVMMVPQEQFLGEIWGM